MRCGIRLNRQLNAYDLFGGGEMIKPGALAEFSHSQVARRTQVQARSHQNTIDVLAGVALKLER